VQPAPRDRSSLEPHETSEHVPQLRPHPARNAEGTERDWSPMITLPAEAAGAALAAAGLWRRDKAGMLVGAAGLCTEN